MMKIMRNDSVPVGVLDRPGGSRPPLPSWGHSAVVVQAPGDGPGYWAGAPSAVQVDRTTYLAYRLRRPVGQGRGYATVVASSTDGIRFTTLTVLQRDAFEADSLERPALVVTPEGRWRLYVSCARPAGPGWWIDMLEADSPDAFDPETRRMVVLADDMTAVKDPVIAYSGGRWHMWVCCHPCAVPSEADQAYTSYATSHDGIEWSWHGTALAPRAGAWDARMARVTAVLTDGPQPVAYYDGRATAAENCEERLGLAVGDGLGSFRAVEGGPFAASPCASGSLRYLAVVRTGDGGHRIYFEAAREDGAHELRVEGVPWPRRTRSDAI